MKKTAAVLIIFFISIFTFVSNAFAQVGINDPEGKVGPLSELRLDIFFPENYTVRGFYSLIAFAFILVFGGLFVAWIIYSLIGAFKIITSGGEEQKVQSGAAYVKNVIIGIAMGFGFFIVLSIVGIVLGFGFILEWPDKLSVCGEEMKFQAEERIFPGKLDGNLVCINDVWMTNNIEPGCDPRVRPCFN